ncbi:hypothetical protein COH67_02785 [Neisseria meningitidis]|nr:hypothetical protein COH67_02785 [Neisseria meningitidis]
MGFSPPIQAIRPKPAAPPIPRNLCPANPATLRHSRRFRHSRESGNPDPPTQQESIGKTETPAAVIPAQAGIQPPNAAGIYRKKPNPRHRHSRAGGNPDPKRGRNLSETAETERTGFPPARE